MRRNCRRIRNCCMHGGRAWCRQRRAALRRRMKRLPRPGAPHQRQMFNHRRRAARCRKRSRHPRRINHQDRRRNRRQCRRAALLQRQAHRRHPRAVLRRRRMRRKCRPRMAVEAVFADSFFFTMTLPVNTLQVRKLIQGIAASTLYCIAQPTRQAQNNGRIRRQERDSCSHSLASKSAPCS
jgi:hypothetical protein